jgi:hypothetical protein
METGLCHLLTWQLNKMSIWQSRFLQNWGHSDFRPNCMGWSFLSNVHIFIFHHSSGLKRVFSLGFVLISMILFGDKRGLSTHRWWFLCSIRISWWVLFCGSTFVK